MERSLGIRGRVIGLAIVPVAIIGVLLMFQLIMGKIDDLDQSLRARALAIARQLAPAAEYGVASGNIEVLQTLLEKAAIEPDVRGVAVFADNGQWLAQVGLGTWANPLAKRVPTDRIYQMEYKDRLVYYAPITRTEVAVDDFNLGDEPNSASSPQPRLLGWVGLDVSRSATIRSQRDAILRSLAILLAGLGVSLYLAWRIGRQITRPILSLTHTVSRIGEGHLEERVEQTGQAELGVLQRGVNHMAAHLQAMQDQMQEKIDRATARLVYQASHDALTGLINRREFEQRLERTLQSALQQGREHALCYMDLDQFKIVNDTSGHAAGDELLRQLTLLMHDRVRDRDTLARLGGDEFGLLLESCQLDAARKIAEQLREMVADFRFIWHDKVFSVGISIGLVPINHPMMTLADIMSAADTACYAAKDGGRNRVRVYEADNDALIQRQGEMQWVTRINEALEENRFLLYCQKIMPQQSVEDEEIHEVLLRIAERDGNIIAPMAFIPAAERYNLMPAIDRWVIKAAFGALRRLIGLGTPKSFIIKLSSASLGDPALLDFIRQQLSSPAILPQHVCFEITETSALIKLSETIRLITELKITGCRFSLGDFGSGMSSFTYLKNLPVDYIKIDGTFVRDLLHDQVDYTIIESIRNIAQAMGLKTIAGFVESEAIMTKLQFMGIHYVQGDWVGRPHPLDEL